MVTDLKYLSRNSKYKDLRSLLKGSSLKQFPLVDSQGNYFSGILLEHALKRGKLPDSESGQWPLKIPVALSLAAALQDLGLYCLRSPSACLKTFHWRCWGLVLSVAWRLTTEQSKCWIVKPGSLIGKDGKASAV